jgi:hypothetical protein
LTAVFLHHRICYPREANNVAGVITLRDAAAGRGAADRRGDAEEAERLPVGVALPVIGLISAALWGLVALVIVGIP